MPAWEGLGMHFHHIGKIFLWYFCGEEHILYHTADPRNNGCAKGFSAVFTNYTIPLPNYPQDIALKVSVLIYLFRFYWIFAHFS